MQGTVGFDFELKMGGPKKEEQRVIATFKAGEKLTLKRVSADGSFPAMYKIAEHPEAGTISWRIVVAFVREFT